MRDDSKLVTRQATSRQIEEMNIIAEAMISAAGVIDVALIYATGVAAAEEVDPVDPESEIARLQKQVDAYRLLAVNEGWSHQLAAAYGHAEYRRQRIEGIDAKAGRTVASGYDAAGYLRDGLA